MARIFSVSFTFEDNVYTALISVRSTPQLTEYTLTMLDDTVSRLLPGNKIISAVPGQYVFQNADTGEERLMNEIIKAVASHVHSLTA